RLYLVLALPLSVPPNPSSLLQSCRSNLVLDPITSNPDDIRSTTITDLPLLRRPPLPSPSAEPLEVEYVEIPTKSTPEGEDVTIIEQDPEVAPTVPAEVVGAEVQQVVEEQ
ncbi:unnamed protein product, partial [Urochloa humidicola]